MDIEKLYRSCYMEVYSFCINILADAHAAEEITQEVFYKALRHQERFHGNAKESTWLCAIAKNACYDYLKRQKKAVSPVKEDIPDDRNLETLILDKQTALSIHKALHELDEPYKEVFQLRVFGELSFQNIAYIFGKTESWARVTYHRSRLKLQERIKTYESNKKN